MEFGAVLAASMNLEGLVDNTVDFVSAVLEDEPSLLHAKGTRAGSK